MELTGDQAVQAEVLEGLATAVNHRQWFVELAEPYLGEDPIEVGSGLGDYAQAWAVSGRHVTATETEPDRLVALKERMAEESNVEVRAMHLPHEDEDEHAGRYSAAVAYNVLEHIHQDVEALASMGRLVRPGGAVVGHGATVVSPARTRRHRRPPRREPRLLVSAVPGSGR